MKTIQSSKDITTLEVGDVVTFGDLEYVVNKNEYLIQYYLYCPEQYNGIIFEMLNLKKRDFIKKLGIDADYIGDFPETKSLEALTAIVSALFKEYEKQNELPKTWEEFCERNPVKRGECFVTSISTIQILSEGVGRDVSFDKNTCTSKQEAEAFLALMQLRQLRKCYIGDWEPDWNCSLVKFCIIVDTNRIRVTDSYFCQRNLSFPTHELAQQFLTNFKDLLEVAKPLL